MHRVNTHRGLSGEGASQERGNHDYFLLPAVISLAIFLRISEVLVKKVDRRGKIEKMRHPAREDVERDRECLANRLG
jgi:hypothetical protein